MKRIIVMGFNDEPMIKQKKYSEEKYKAKKNRSFGVAKRILIMYELSSISLVNIITSLGLFLVSIIGTSAIAYFFNINIDFSPETFSIRGGIFVKICMVFLIIFTISGFGYAIGYKKLEIMCIHLDGELDGALEVNEAAQRDNLVNNLEKSAGLNPSSFNSFSGAESVAYNYLNKNGIKIPNVNIFSWIKRLLIFAQIILALACVVILIK